MRRPDPSPNTADNPPGARRPDSRGTVRLLVLVFFMVATGMAAIGYYSYRGHERAYRAQVERQLSSIADLKVGDIGQWRQERVADGALLFRNAAFFSLVRRAVGKRPETEARRQLLEWLRSYPAANRQYDQVSLVDANGVTRMSASAIVAPVSSTILRRVQDVLRSRKIAFQDFYRDEYDQRVYLAILVPVLDDSEGGPPVGAVVLRIDPAVYVYPFIQRWPTPSPTAETLLVRREGNDVVFLNTLRFRKNAALTLRAAVNQALLPAGQAVLGRAGITEGIDYRGVSVLAALRPVPGSPWFLVARMDSAEVDAPIHQRLWEMIGLVAAAMFGMAGGLTAIWREQAVRVYRDRATAVEAIRRLNVELEARVRARTAELAAANKELEAFSYSVSHDLRAPLRAMDGFSMALMEDCAGKLDETAQDYLRRIRSGSQRMAGLIDDLLELSRISQAEVRRERVDLTAMAGEIGGELRGLSPGRDVELAVAPALAASVDERLVRVVLNNMLDNAWKFTATRAHARIEFGARSESGQRVFFVRDNGAGFDMAYAHRLFGAFQRLHSAQEFAGTGIGLALVQRVVRRHGGSVWAEGAVNRGATFYFTLGEGGPD